MENTVFTDENLEIERSVEEIKQLKAAIACRIASLHEAVHQRAELQASLTHFGSAVQQLQDQQYQLFKWNVDEEFRKKDIIKN